MVQNNETVDILFKKRRQKRFIPEEYVHEHFPSHTPGREITSRGLCI